MWLGASERVFIFLGERSAYFLHPKASFKLAILGLSVGSLRNWWIRRVMRGIGLELSGSVISREREVMKVSRTCTVSLVGHIF